MSVSQYASDAKIAEAVTALGTSAIAQTEQGLLQQLVVAAATASGGGGATNSLLLAGTTASDLTALTAATVATGGLFYGTQSGADRKFTLTAAGATLAEAADAAAQRTALGVLALTGGTLTGPLTITGGTVTTSTPLLIQTQTWNGSTVAFKTNTLNITNTASKAYSDTTWADVSTVFEYQVGGVAKLAFIPVGSENSVMLRLGGTDANHPLLKDAQTAGGIIFRGSGGLADFACVGRMGDGTTGVTVANFNGLGRIGFNSTANVMAGGNSAADAFFQRGGAAHIKLGATHATTATNQTLSAHNVTATGIGASLILKGGTGPAGDGSVLLGSATGAIGFYGSAGSTQVAGDTTLGVAAGGSGSAVLDDTTFNGGSGNAYTIGGIVAALKSYGLLG